MTSSQGFASPGIGQSPSTDRRVSLHSSCCVPLKLGVVHAYVAPSIPSLLITYFLFYLSSFYLPSPLFLSPSLYPSLPPSLFLPLSCSLTPSLCLSIPPSTSLSPPSSHQGGRSQDITPVTSAQVYSATESGDKFKIDNREMSQVRLRRGREGREARKGKRWRQEVEEGVGKGRKEEGREGRRGGIERRGACIHVCSVAIIVFYSHDCHMTVRW